MATPEDVPILATPKSIYFWAVTASLIPPDAFIFILLPTAFFIKTTSSKDAPLGPNPVEVFTKSALAFTASLHAVIISSSVK